jgi:hypothetical protein
VLFGELNAGNNSSRNYDGREMVQQLKLHLSFVYGCMAG